MRHRVEGFKHYDGSKTVEVWAGSMQHQAVLRKKRALAPLFVHYTFSEYAEPPEHIFVGKGHQMVGGGWSFELVPRPLMRDYAWAAAHAFWRMCSGLRHLALSLLRLGWARLKLRHHDAVVWVRGLPGRVASWARWLLG